MSERLYRWLLRLYPRAFRKRYADEMTRVMRERLKHEGAVRVWMDVMRDLVVSIPRQHLHPQLLRPSPWQNVMLNSMPSLAPVLIASCVLGAAAGVRMSLPHVDNAPLALVLDGAIAVLFVFIVVFIVVLIKRRMVALHRARAGLRIEATESAVTVLNNDTTLQTLRREDISSAEQHKHWLWIQSAATGDLIVPIRMPGYEAVQQRVSGWVPVTSPEPLWRRGASLPTIARTFVRSESFILLLQFCYAILSLVSHTRSLVVGGMLVTVVVLALFRRDLSFSKKLWYVGLTVLLTREWWWH